MEVTKIEQLFVNVNRGLLYKASFSTQDNSMLGVVGCKVEVNACKVKIETCEMNTLRINNKWYDIIEQKDDICSIKPIKLTKEDKESKNREDKDYE